MHPKAPGAFWFKRRRYGWGWYPVTWQGWGAVGLYLLAVGIIASWDSLWSVAAIAFATLLLLLVTILRGPSPRWRWGPRPEDNPDEDY